MFAVRHYLKFYQFLQFSLFGDHALYLGCLLLYSNHGICALVSTREFPKACFGPIRMEIMGTGTITTFLHLIIIITMPDVSMPYFGVCTVCYFLAFFNETKNGNKYCKRPNFSCSWFFVLFCFHCRQYLFKFLISCF